MIGRKLASLSLLLGRMGVDCVARSPERQLFPVSFFCTTSEQVGSAKRPLRRRAIPILLLSLTGGVALSAVNDIAIFHGCSSKAIEKASENQKVIEALGNPIVRGPWYEASLAVGHRRNWVSCTFPVSGPKGSGIFQLKAVRQGEDNWFSFLRHHDWDILVMEALIQEPSEDDNVQQTLKINITENLSPSEPLVGCKACLAQEARVPGN
ncbi:hypothetical protein HPP92_014817 [Vanilla planifolia]|uniref:Uncharacterized protein n=1 Tax=Vanilla planifolia TaxID=51239 RepID=A0A835UUG9_VANPL|nr:hypothetical protein HPP92_014817 [Vanilla planifolia]